MEFPECKGISMYGIMKSSQVSKKFGNSECKGYRYYPIHIFTSYMATVQIHQVNSYASITDYLLLVHNVQSISPEKTIWATK
jgi:hypothetical protein